MAATVTIDHRTAMGSRESRMVTITGDNSYPTGGYAVTAAQFGLTLIDMITGGVASGGHGVTYDVANKKLLFFNGTTEIANTTDLHLVTVVLHVWGKGK